MIVPRFFPLLICLFFSACKKDLSEVVSTDFRKTTTLDHPLKIDATSDEMFREPINAPVKGNAPAHWTVKPATQFRLLNFSFATHGEVYVSESTGTVLDNANRWLKQFSLPPMDAEKLASLPKEKLLETDGVWLEAEGTYTGGMGAAAQEGRALRGIITAVGNSIYTIKMVGTLDEVKAEQENLRNFSHSLEIK